MSRPPRVLPGDRFGMLTVTGQAPSRGKGTRWTCRCDCGRTTTVPGVALRNGNTGSCGCRRSRGPTNAAAWTPAEDEFLQRHYQRGGVAAVIAAGVHRSAPAIRNRAAVLGVTLTTPRYARLNDPAQHDTEHPLDWAAILTRMPPDLAKATLASLDEYRRQNGRELWRPT